MSPAGARDPRVNDRLDQLADYPFTRLRRLLADLAPAPGRTPLVLSLGEPQRPAPVALIEAAIAAHRADWHRYPPVAGTPGLRQAIAEALTRRYRLPADLIDPDRRVLPVAGTREALFLAAQLVARDGAGGAPPVVLMPEPFYAVYLGAAVLGGFEPVMMPATAATGHLPRLDEVPGEVLARTRLCFLASPSNPQGAVADLGYLGRALALARRHGFVLAVDECYADLYDQVPPPGTLEAAAAAGGRLDNLLVFHSLSKRSSAAGLRAGAVVGDPALIAAFTRLRSYGHAGTPLPLMAAAAALWRDPDHVDANRAAYRAGLDAASAALAGRLGFVRPAAGLFLWLEVGDGEQAARRLWAEAAVKVLPGAYLCRADPAGAARGAGYVRVALVHPPEVIADACRRIAATLAP